VANDYIPRVVDEELDQIQLPAVILEGAKAVGKTRTLERRARTIHRLDRASELQLAQDIEDWVTSGERPVLIDEFQRHAHTIDKVRRIVDADYSPRQFYLAGSAGESADTHSGAGRIVTIRMRPLSFAERQLATPTVSLAELCDGHRPALSGSSEIGLAAYVEEMLRSGFPAIRTLDGRDRRRALGGYIDRAVQRDIPIDVGRSVRQPDQLRRWLRAYAAATATTTSLETIRDAAHRGDGVVPNRGTTLSYRDALQRLWIIDDLPAWQPGLSHFAPLLQQPKRHLLDPALGAALLGVTAEKLLSGETSQPALARDGTLLGALFESLVTLSVRVYAQPADTTVAHFRERHGRHEVDLIVERPDAAIVAIETKLSDTVTDADVAHLLWLRNQIGDRLLDAIVVYTGALAYRRRDGIGVVPLALLGP
jgi:uncharacterized protein